jgi:hypothetical protein
MKRLFNSLQLLNIVAGKKKLFDEKSGPATMEEKQRIMFAALCLQFAYEPVYRFLQRQDDIKEDLFEILKDEEKIKISDDLREVISELQDVNETKIKKLCQFMKTFFEAVQLKSDTDKGALSAQEIATIEQILSFSSLTSTDASASGMDSAERYKNKAMAKVFVEELNSKLEYSNHLVAIKDNFKIYQPRNSEDICIFFDIRKDDIVFTVEFYFNNTEMTCLSYARTAKSVPTQRAWFDQEQISAFFPMKSYIPEKWIYVLWKNKFEPSLNREQREQHYKSEVIRTLDYLFPKIVEYLSKNA